MNLEPRSISPPGARAKVLVIGDVMTDVLVKPVGPLIRGSDRRATIRTVYGGSGFNQAIWLGHFGVTVALAAKVGGADLAAYEERLRCYGVASALSADNVVASGTLVSIIDPDGQRSFLTSRGANDELDGNDLPESLLDGVAVLQISGYSLVSERARPAVLSFVEKARGRGTLISTDPGSASFLEEMGPANFLQWTSGADFCFPNEEEAAILTGASDRGRQRRRLSEVYSLTVIKRGAGGAEVVEAGGVCSQALSAPMVEAVDTTGAGDAFLAGFLATYLSTGSTSASLGRAIAAGADATTVFGGQPRRPLSDLT